MRGLLQLNQLLCEMFCYMYVGWTKSRDIAISVPLDGKACTRALINVIKVIGPAVHQVQCRGEDEG